MWHDNSGLGPGWHLDYIEVQSSATGRVYYFPCSQWFDKKQGDGAIKRRLIATTKVRHVARSATGWLVGWTGLIHGMAACGSAIERARLAHDGSRPVLQRHLSVLPTTHPTTPRTPNAPPACTLACAQDPRSFKSQYRVTTITSDISGAGTDANVFIIIYGPEGDTGKVMLDNKLK